MADVAKNVVRDEPGGEEEEDDDRSLGDLIEEELRNLGNKAWVSGDAGWSTVEEVARELTASPEPKPRGSESTPREQILPQEKGDSPAVEPDCQKEVGSSLVESPVTIALDSPIAESTLMKAAESPIDESTLMKAAESPLDEPTHTKEVDSSILESTPPPSPALRSPRQLLPSECLEHALMNGETHTMPESDSPLTPASPENDSNLLLMNGNHDLSSMSSVVEETSIENCNDSVHEELIVNCSQSSVHDEVRNCIESVLDEVVQETITTEVHYNVETEISETTTVVEKKKKKKSTGSSETGEETVTATKKKTKKSKKSEGKENHISVIENGHGAEEPLSPSSMSPVEDDDLSNVCVKDLKLNYVNEASKSFTAPEKPAEVPVPPPVSIRELKSSFSKFDQLSKKTVLHVRSSDPAKAQKTFSQGAPDGQTAVLCKACQKQVFAMEQIKAERAVWHKNCFRCHTCNKQLTVDIYQSHEGELYCKPHFRELFQPKAVLDNEEDIHASDKPDLGLEELSSLNVKSRFQVFEKQQQDQADGELERSPTTVSVKRSSSIMSKLVKFQKKGMDVGVTDESLNGFVYEETSSSEEESGDEEEDEDKGVIKCRRKARERPVSFSKMDDVKRNWESVNQSQRREEMREERKQELQQIRSRLFQGKQGKMKELYEQAVAESESKGGRRESGEELASLGDKAKLVRERFEKGEAAAGDGDNKKAAVEEDMAVFEEGISKKSRSIFLEMEAAAAKAAPVLPVQNTPARTDSVRRPRETESPEREVYRDPDVVRCDDKLEDESAIKRSQTASRMLSVFRQLEEKKEVLPDGPKPKKCFTPPPDYKGGSESSEEEGTEEEEEEESEEEEEESETEDGVVKSSYKIKDEFLDQARNAARAKQLAAKFEAWEPEKQSTNNAINMLDSEHASIESTKSLKARFESLQNEQPKEKLRPKVNRFVEQPTSTICAYCDTKVYPLEKIETNGKVFHKNCFRCSYCNCVLRMDTYTLNNGHLYCLPHFKQLFISKGNYDEGFGSDQHKRKWEQPVNGNTSS